MTGPDSNLPSPARAAALDWSLRFCGLASVLAFLGLLWSVLSPHLGAPFPEAARPYLILLVSASIGFATNWLAIKMLFRPRRPQPWLFVWSQGLIPREQPRFAAAIGRVASERLLSPEAIARALGDREVRAPLGTMLRKELDALLSSPVVREELIRAITRALRQHGPAAARALRPQLRRAIESALETHLTAERVIGWLETGFKRFAQRREMRRALAKWIIQETSSEGVMTRVMEILREQFYRYRQRHPVRGFFAEQFVIEWDDVQRSIVETLKSEEATENLTEALVGTATSLAERMHEPATAEAVGAIRGRLIDRALDWFETDGIDALATRLRDAADEPRTWSAVESVIDEIARQAPHALFDDEGELRPRFRAHIEEVQQRLVEVFPVAGVVERQVLEMDPAAIEELTDEIARRELAWIQILGFVIGGIAGGVLLLAV